MNVHPAQAILNEAAEEWFAQGTADLVEAGKAAWLEHGDDYVLCLTDDHGEPDVYEVMVLVYTEARDFENEIVYELEVL